MAVFRVERTQGYTVMSNYHLRDKSLSLKAKGLLSQMLSLPEDWDYTLSGLAVINRESKDAIRSAVNELEKAGYIKRRQTTDAGGKFSANEYVIHERPVTEEPPPQPSLEKPLSGFPTTDNPMAGKPSTENPTQIIKEKSNTQKSITDQSITDSIPFRETAAEPPEPKRRETMSLTEMENYRELILENIEYDCLKQRFGTYREDLDEIVELLVETVCAKRKTTRIAGADFPHATIPRPFSFRTSTTSCPRTRIRPPSLRAGAISSTILTAPSGSSCPSSIWRHPRKPSPSPSLSRPRGTILTTSAANTPRCCKTSWQRGTTA